MQNKLFNWKIVDNIQIYFFKNNLKCLKFKDEKNFLINLKKYTNDNTENFIGANIDEKELWFQI